LAQRQRVIWLAILALGLLTAALHAQAYRGLFAGTCIDDAYISFRYSENLANGNGLVFNSGERVEGYSNFLWVVTLAPFVAMQDDISQTASLLGLALALLALVVAARGLSDVFGIQSPWALAALLSLVAGSGYFAAWSISGLETGLYALLLTLAWYLYSQANSNARWFLAAVVFALLALTRPEGLAFGVAAATLYLLARHGRLQNRWLFPLVLLLIVVAYHAWRLSWFGWHWFPNSVEAKMGGGVHQVWRGLRYVTGNFLLPYLPLLSAVVLLKRTNRPRGSVLGLLMVGLYLAMFTAAGGDWSWGRFFGPVLPLASLLFVGTLWHSWQQGVVPLSRRSTVLIGLVLSLYIAFTADISSRQRTWQQWSRYAAADKERVAMGKWMRQNLPNDTKVAAFAIGQLAYYSGFYTHDMLGITDSHIANLKMPGMGRGVPGHEKYDANYTLTVVKPDVIIGAELLPGMPSSGVFMSQYQNVEAFWTHHKVAMHKNFARRAMQQRRNQ